MASRLLPDYLYLIDDEEEHIEPLEELLADISWIRNVRGRLPTNAIDQKAEDVSDLEEKIGRCHPNLLEIAKTPDALAYRTKKFCIRTENTMLDAVRAISAERSAIAFVDFSYRESPALEKIIALYHERCSPPWTDLRANPETMGGRVFSSLFKDQLRNPTRVLCPNTAAMPTVSKLEKRASITRPFECRNGMLQTMEAIVTALDTWIRLSLGSPLEDLWNATEKWFGKWETIGASVPSPRSGFVPHTLANLTKRQIDDYRALIEEKTRIHIPWNDFASIAVVHDSLKALCGQDYCGRPGPTLGKYNLTIGSALLIAELAYKDAGVDSSGPLYQLHQSMRRKKPVLAVGEGTQTDSRSLNLGDYPGLRSQLLPQQRKEPARLAATSLYWLFRNLFTIDPDHPEGRFRQLNLADSGRSLICELEGWNVSELISAVEVALQKPEAVRNSLDGAFPDSWDIGTTIAMFILSGICNEQGVGTQGTIEFRKGHSNGPMQVRFSSSRNSGSRRNNARDSGVFENNG